MNGDSYTSRGGGRERSERDHMSSRRDRDDRRDRDGERTRRRSRSPYHSSSRRDGGGGGGGGDVDSYSSSRNHRDREREDRYGGDRHGSGRDYDRDRTSRREGGSHRDDDRRAPPRRGDRDRDLFADRQRGRDRDHDRDRGGRGDRGDRGVGGRRDNDRDRDRDEDQFRSQQRQRSATPPKKREPTPDLTDVVPILERKRRLTQWDMKPPGYDAVTAEQAKLSGMFPLPGAPRQQAMDPVKLQAFINPGGENKPVVTGTLKPTMARQSKRLVVSDLPASATEDSVASFFNLQLNGLNVIDSTDPCILAQISADRSFALLEFRSPSETTVALALDGSTMEADEANGSGPAKGLQIRRPKDYIVPAVADETGYEPGVVSNVVLDTPNKLSITNIPPYLTSEQVLELLVSFGELKAFVLVQDRGTEESRGIAFCEYADAAATAVAADGLNGMELGDRHLKVQKASIGITQVAGVDMGVNAMSMLAGTTATDTELSRVLQLLNMVTADELLDNDDYEEILEDVREECSKFGAVADIKVPRPSGGARQAAGVGKIFVKYEDNTSATKALQALAGRKFADRTVVTTYFPEENFEVSAW